MKRIVTALVAALVLLTACTNNGKKIKIEGSKGEIYLKGEGVTETDAKNLGDFLKEQQYFTNEKKVSVQLLRDGEGYTVRFVYNKSVYDTLKGANQAFRVLAIRASKEVFGNKKVTIALAGDTFKDYTTIPYDEALAKELENAEANGGGMITKEDFDHDTAGGIDFYWKGISDEESGTIAKHIVEAGYFPGPITELYMTRENDRFVIRFPVSENTRNNPSALAKIESISRQLKDNLFANAAFSFVVTDEKFTTVQAWDY